MRFHVESADWIPKWIKENLVENVSCGGERKSDTYSTCIDLLYVIQMYLFHSEIALESMKVCKIRHLICTYGPWVGRDLYHAHLLRHKTLIFDGPPHLPVFNLSEKQGHIKYSFFCQYAFYCWMLLWYHYNSSFCAGFSHVIIFRTLIDRRRVESQRMGI